MTERFTAAEMLEHQDRMAAAWPHPWPLRRDMIFGGYVGSIAHGTKVATSTYDDIDFMGIAIAPPVNTLGPLEVFDHWCPVLDPEGHGPLGNLDVVVYSLRKFVGLLLKGNPNVLGLLYLPPRCWMWTNLAWDRLYDQREIFLSERVITAHAGYAQGQLHKLGTPNARGYMGRERKELFARFGYDPKNASHLVRLLRMGCEYAETGDLQVDRTRIDAQELIEIKEGRWPLARIQREAEEGFRRLHEAKARKLLPPHPDAGRANALVAEITLRHWRDRLIEADTLGR